MPSIYCFSNHNQISFWISAANKICCVFLLNNNSPSKCLPPQATLILNSWLYWKCQKTIIFYYYFHYMQQSNHFHDAWIAFRAVCAAWDSLLKDPCPCLVILFSSPCAACKARQTILGFFFKNIKYVFILRRPLWAWLWCWALAVNQTQHSLRIPVLKTNSIVVGCWAVWTLSRFKELVGTGRWE